MLAEANKGIGVLDAQFPAERLKSLAFDVDIGLGQLLPNIDAAKAVRNFQTHGFKSSTVRVASPSRMSVC